VILIISDPEDGHVLPVASELNRRGAEYVVFDPAAYPNACSATIESSALGLTASLCVNHRIIDFKDVRGIWYRRPNPFVHRTELLPEEQKWLDDECQHFLRGFWATQRNVRWVSHPDAIRIANSKVHQLALAAELGFTVPRFAITNDVDKAWRFLASCPDGAVVKVLATPSIQFSHKVGTIYTHLLKRDDFYFISSVQHGPTFFQEFIDKTMDVRVTVMGNNLFAVGIDSQNSEQARVDFRRAKIYTLPHKVLTLPQDISTRCIELVSALNLNFGAIDLVVTQDGRYIFLEINPNGQWYWLEEVTGIPLTTTMCDLLAGSHR